jgi:F-type H+-transporting ATPase subunit a
MNNAQGIETHDQWSAGWLVGSTHPLLQLNKATIVNTWILLLIILIILIPVNRLLKKPDSIARFIILSAADFFIDLCDQALGIFSFRHIAFITTLFCFILGCNILSIVPWLEEPTTDPNTTFALGIFSFLYVQSTDIANHGIVHYVKDFFTPFFLMAPLHIVSKLASILSISFRLFGNIFGGSLISNIYFNALRGTFILEAIGLLSGINLLIILFFGLFEGFLQAFVFTMLTLTYLAMAVQRENNQ